MTLTLRLFVHTNAKMVESFPPDTTAKGETNCQNKTKYVFILNSYT